MFLETSAKTGHAVEEAFLKCSKNILAKIETGELDPERIGSGKSLSYRMLCLHNLSPSITGLKQTLTNLYWSSGIQYGESLLRRTDQLSATRRAPDCANIRSSCRTWEQEAPTVHPFYSVIHSKQLGWWISSYGYLRLRIFSIYPYCTNRQYIAYDVKLGKSSTNGPLFPVVFVCIWPFSALVHETDLHLHF